MNKRQLVAGVLSASLLAAALPGLALAQDEEENLAAEGVEWALASYADGESMADLPEAVDVTLLLSGGEAVGSAGCNSYFGSYEIDATSLSFPEPFGSTRMLCEGPAQAIEDAYLPLLQKTAGWSVDEGGMLNLTDADGATTLIYGEAPVEITASEVAALVTELESLQAQIDTASDEVAALTKEVASADIKKLDKRVAAVEDDVKALEKKTKGLNVDNLKKRIKTNEEDIAGLSKQMSKVKNRLKALETTSKDHEARITALEEPAPVPTQLPE